MAPRRLRILFMAPEVEPFAKTGGLADVAGALPAALAGLGHDIRILMPKYRDMKTGRCGPRENTRRCFGSMNLPCYPFPGNSHPSEDLRCPNRLAMQSCCSRNHWY